jgi:hypothetical protein
VARRAVKLLHVLGSTAYTGGLVAYMLLLATATPGSIEELSVLRQGVATISHWIIMPSLVVVLVSGLFALVVHHPFQQARWVWIKVILGLPMFEGTLLVVDSTAQRAAARTAEAAANGVDGVLLQQLLQIEWTGYWGILALAIANIVISVWRPALRWERWRMPWSRHDAADGPAS